MTQSGNQRIKTTKSISIELKSVPKVILHTLRLLQISPAFLMQSVTFLLL